MQKARKGVVRCPLFDLSQNWLIPDGKGTCHPIHLVDKRDHAGRAADLCRLNFIENKPARCPEISSVEYKGPQRAGLPERDGRFRFPIAL